MSVFIVQNTNWVDPKDGKLKPKFDFSSAEEFGELKELLHASASPFRLEPVVASLHLGLATYDWQKDWLLLVGSPVLIGLACTVAADKSDDGKLSLLQWSGAKRRYIPVAATAFGDCAQR